MTEQLGRLERVTDLREIWKTEATHFTAWLAREESGQRGLHGRVWTCGDGLGFVDEVD